MNCIGIDYSVDMLRLARSNLGAKAVPLVQAECEKIPLPDASVDCIVCLGVISYAVSIEDRKSTRLNSSHVAISYAVFCLKKKIHQHQHCQDNGPQPTHPTDK